MIKTFSATVRSLNFTVTPMMAKAFAVFIALCFFANVLVPRIVINTGDYSAIRQLIKKRPILIEYFSLSVLPVKILNAFFNEQRKIFKVPLKKAPIGCTDNMSKNLPDLFVAGSSIQNISKPLSLFGQAGNLFAILSKNISNTLCAYPGNTTGLPLFAFVFLIFCFMKARGALPDAAGIILSAGTSLPRLAGVSRGFCL